MDKLYVQTPNGNILIDPEIVRKYGLRKGMKSPFSKEPIVDERGDGAIGQDPSRPASENSRNGEGMINDELARLDNGMTLLTSEIIDISQGTDSEVGDHPITERDPGR